jgi:hypothetical protein
MIILSSTIDINKIPRKTTFFMGHKNPNHEIPFSTCLISKLSASTPTRRPPDLPLARDQNQAKFLLQLIELNQESSKYFLLVS